MKNQLISLETAILASEKRFNLYKNCNVSILYDKPEIGLPKGTNIGSLGNPIINIEKYVLRPTQSILLRWLREVHKIEVISYPIIVGSYSFKIYKFTEIINIIYLNGRNVSNKKDNNKSWPNYEESLEDGLQEALKLIK
jgi:hypothetical protein